MAKHIVGRKNDALVEAIEKRAARLTWVDAWIHDELYGRDVARHALD